MSCENSGLDKVESFLDSNPDFLNWYLRRRMKAAVSCYLENNPQFLKEYLDSLPDTYIGNSDSLSRNFTGNNRNTNHLLTQTQENPLLSNSKPALRSTLSSPGNSSSHPPSCSNRISSYKKFQNTSDCSELQPFSHFTLHGQQNMKNYSSVSYFQNKFCDDSLFLELVRELNISGDPDQFCFTALRHVSTLLAAEKCSLFWMRDSAKGDSKELASRLWNITATSSFNDVVCNAKNEMVLSINSGIVGYVARTKEPMIVTNVYEHEHFDKSIDDKTGYESRDILCYPLILVNEDNKVVGVVEVLNKKSKEAFTEDDLKLQNDLSGNVANLWVGRSYDEVLKGLVLQVSELVQCERYTLAVAMVDNCNIEGCLQFARSYDMLLQKPKSNMFGESEEVVKQVDVIKLKKNDWIFSHKVIAKVIETKQPLNMSKITPFSEFKLEDAKKEFSLKTVLCVPYYDGANRLLGILHLANKKKGFDEDDEAIVESIRPYLMNGLLFANGFNSIAINKAKTDVADDIVRFHTRAFDEEVERNEEIPEGEKFNLYEFSFSDIPMTDDDTVLGALRMFEDLDAFNLFKIQKETMLRWIISVRRCYRPVYYHNWRHGFNVAHTMFLLIDRLNKATMTPGISSTFSDREKFTLVVAGFCHDIDHRGTNNAFLIRAGAPLAVLYNTSTLENHHYDTCLRISSMPGNNIFESFTKEEFESSCELMKHAILATDLALYFQRRNSFKALLEAPAEERDFTGENKMLLMSMMMTASDLSSITKPWEVQQKMAKLVTSEFFDQGDQERELFGTEPMPMMDRSKQGELPKMQIGFIDGVCSMAYNMMADFCPEYAPLRDGMRDNRQRWKDRWIEQGMPDPDAPKAKEAKKEEDIGDMWEKYWNMDPENFIWGIDPNEAPPEVVIERVVFSPKKKGPGENSMCEANDVKPKKKKKNKDKESNVVNGQHSHSTKGQSKACVIM